MVQLHGPSEFQFPILKMLCFDLCKNKYFNVYHPDFRFHPTLSAGGTGRKASIV